MKNKIVLVEDDEEIRKMITDYLSGEFEVVSFGDGSTAIQTVTDYDEYSLALIDLMLPDMSGMEIIKNIRQGSNIPIIIITAKDNDTDKSLGLNLGADDYVVKPFSPRELMMRVKVVISRNNKKDVRGGHEIFQAEGLVVDFTGRTVTVDGKRVEMSPKEYELLFYLVRNRNIALDREKLITEVWGYDYYGDDRTLDTHIKLLRSSLGGYRKFLVTLRGVGYRFEA